MSIQELIAKHKNMCLTDAEVGRPIAEVERLSRVKEENEKLKGECICGHDGKLTSADCPRHGTIELSLADHAKRAKNLVAEVGRLQVDHGRACHLVAKMHFAATGSTDGPKRGVVEDVEDALTRSKAEGRREGLERAAKIADDQNFDHNDCDGCRTARTIAAAIRQQAVQGTEEKADVCGWKPWNDESGCYDTGCGNVQYFSEGNVADNRYKVCPYCGKSIMVKA